MRVVRNILSFTLLFSLAIGSLGCATQPRFIVHVDSIRGKSAVQEKKYVLLPGNENTSSNDLQFQEFSGYVRRALAAHEYQEASRSEQADLAIFLGYGIGKPEKQQYSYSLPVWGQTGVSSSYTYGTVNTYGNSGTFSGTTTYTPTYGVTGYQSHTGTRTTYSRFMFLSAYDLNKNIESQNPVQLWKTSVTSTGSSGDLRRVFPLLVAASKDYIGSNTERQVTITLYETDDAVMDIKMGQEDPGGGVP